MQLRQCRRVRLNTAVDRHVNPYWVNVSFSTLRSEGDNAAHDLTWLYLAFVGNYPINGKLVCVGLAGLCSTEHHYVLPPRCWQNGDKATLTSRGGAEVWRCLQLSIGSTFCCLWQRYSSGRTLSYMLLIIKTRSRLLLCIHCLLWVFIYLLWLIWLLLLSVESIHPLIHFLNLLLSLVEP